MVAPFGVLFEQIGMISNWTTTDRSDLLTEYLMRDKDEDGQAASDVVLQHLENTRRVNNASLSKGAEVTLTGENIRTASQRQRCIDLLDSAWRQSRPSDLKIALAPDALAELFGYEGLDKQLLGLHLHPERPKIANTGTCDGVHRVSLRRWLCDTCSTAYAECRHSLPGWAPLFFHQQS